MEIRLNQPYSFTQLGQRGNQEDARYPDSDEPKGAKPFFVVCDGVGGSNKGEVASRTVCDAFGQALSNTDWSKEFTIRDFEKALDFAFSALEEKTTPENKGMATTLTFVAFHKGGCFIAHIGDSRVYYVRPGEGIVYKTEDHSLVNALVRAGVITQEEAATHPDRNVITRSVCVPEGDQERSTATTVNISDVREGDYVFLCSDGVLKKLTDGRLVDILSASASDKDKRDAIAGLSKDIILQVRPFEEFKAPAEKAIMITNPPYGERIGVRGNRNLEENERATRFYQAFGTTLKQRFPGWRVFLFTADFNVPKLLRLKESRKTPFYNGPIECRLFRFDMVAGSNRARKPVTFRIARPAPSAGETPN